MKVNMRKWIGIFFLVAVFLSSNLTLNNEAYNFGKIVKCNLAYGAPKRAGGFKSGSFKSSSPKSGGFKSGIFKFSKPKQSQGSGTPKTNKGLFSGYKNNSNTHTRSFVPIFIPWGGGHMFGIGSFGLIKFLFDLLLIIIIIAIILKFMRKRK